MRRYFLRKEWAMNQLCPNSQFYKSAKMSNIVLQFSIYISFHPRIFNIFLKKYSIDRCTDILTNVHITYENTGFMYFGTEYNIKKILEPHILKWEIWQNENITSRKLHYYCYTSISWIWSSQIHIYNFEIHTLSILKNI